MSDDDTGETRRRKHRAAYSLYAIGSVVAGAVALVVYVFPTQTWWTQRHAEADLRTKLTILDEQNQQLAAQISRLDSDAEVIKVARGQYGLVFPNEKAFVVLPASLPDFPQAWPFNVVKAFFTVDR